MAQDNDHGILAFILGGLIGAGITLLLAPWSGKETREKIRETSEEVKGKAENYYAQTIEKLSKAVEKGKEILDRERFNLKSAIEAGKEAYQKRKGKLEEEAEKPGTSESI